VVPHQPSKYVICALDSSTSALDRTTSKHVGEAPRLPRYPPQLLLSLSFSKTPSGAGSPFEHDVVAAGSRL